MSVFCYISIGSNLGESRQIIHDAVEVFDKAGFKPVLSTLYRTSPQIVYDQPDFLNGMIRIETDFSPLALLDFCQKVELDFYRDRSGSAVLKGPRTLDLDIITYGNETFSHERLHIPHREYRRRKFVLIPMLEIDPDLIDSETGEALYSIAVKLGDQGIYFSNLNDYSNNLNPL